MSLWFILSFALLAAACYCFPRSSGDLIYIWGFLGVSAAALTLFFAPWELQLVLAGAAAVVLPLALGKPLWTGRSALEAIETDPSLITNPKPQQPSREHNGDGPAEEILVSVPASLANRLPDSSLHLNTNLPLGQTAAATSDHLRDRSYRGVAWNDTPSAAASDPAAVGPAASATAQVTVSGTLKQKLRYRGVSIGA